MKKLLMAVMLFCGVVSGFAQSKGDFRIGPTVGMNVANVTNLDNSECRIGFNLGARVDYGFTNNIYFGSGLILSQKGFEYKNGNFAAKPLYVTLPLHIGYSHSLGNVVSVFGETGPSLNFGVGGRYKIGDGDNAFHPEFFGDNGAEVFDMGWDFRLGVEANHFQIHMGYEIGITKTDVFRLGSAKLDAGHNSNFTVGVSYMF